MPKQIKQIGLWSTDESEIKALVKRVNDFNIKNIGTPIKLDIIPQPEGNREKQEPHYQLMFVYPSKDAQKAFWLGN